VPFAEADAAAAESGEPRPDSCRGLPMSVSRLVRPPGLQTDEGRSASRLELFFDLAFVLVVAELAGALSKDLSGHGAVKFAGLYVVAWWTWASSTLYANRFDTDDVVFRILKLTGMLAVLGMAASASDATGKRVVQFVACYVLLRILLFVMYARAWRSVPEARPTINLYLVGAGTGAALWSASLLTDGWLRYALWAVGLAIEVLIPVTATFAPGSVPLHLEHLPERLGLFVILVLGESVASVAQGVHDVSWTADSVAVAVVCFVLTAGLWWSTFDFAGAAAKRLLLGASDEGRRIAEDAFFYGHLPITLGLVATAVGIEHLILESSAAQAAYWTRLVLCGGVAIYLASVSLTNSALSGRWRTGWWWLGPAALLALAAAVVTIPSVALVALLAAIVVGVVAFGIVQEGRGEIELEQL